MVPILTHFTVYLVQNDNVNKGSPYWLSCAMGFGWLAKTGQALVGSESPLRNLGLRGPKSGDRVRIMIFSPALLQILYPVSDCCWFLMR